MATMNLDFNDTDGAADARQAAKQTLLDTALGTAELKTTVETSLTPCDSVETREAEPAKRRQRDIGTRQLDSTILNFLRE